MVASDFFFERIMVASDDLAVLPGAVMGLHLLPTDTMHNTDPRAYKMETKRSVQWKLPSEPQDPHPMDRGGCRTIFQKKKKPPVRSPPVRDTFA
jgi:hypothetical protein